MANDQERGSRKHLPLSEAFPAAQRSAYDKLINDTNV